MQWKKRKFENSPVGLYILLHILSYVCSNVRIDPALGLSLCRGRVATWELDGTRPEMEITKNKIP